MQNLSFEDIGKLTTIRRIFTNATVASENPARWAAFLTTPEGKTIREILDKF